MSIQTEHSIERVRLAVDLAIRHQSHLTALFAREWSREQFDRRKTAELGLVSAAAISRLDYDIENSIEAAAERLRYTLSESTRGHDLRADLVAIGGPAAVAVPQYARYADLCILARDEPEGPPSINYTFAEQLLFVTGRPVLFVPTDQSLEALGRKVVVAWNSSRPAARSLNDALPIIEKADQTTVVMITPSSFIDSHEGPPAEHLAEHLARHGATVNIKRIDNVAHVAIADRLQVEARALGADLIIAGAFGHPRLWEKMLGGVTHDLIAHMRLPIFMSH